MSSCQPAESDAMAAAEREKRLNGTQFALLRAIMDSALPHEVALTWAQATPLVPWLPAKGPTPLAFCTHAMQDLLLLVIDSVGQGSCVIPSLVLQLITTLYNDIKTEAQKDNAKWGINDISRGYQ